MKKAITLFTFIICCFFNLSAQVTAAFSADLTTGCTPLTVDFTDLSIASTGTIITWHWQFIGSTTVDNVTDQNPTFVFNDPDDYEVCLIVTNDLGQADTLCQTAYITTFEEPIADAGPDVTLSCTNPTATLNGAGSSTGPGISYEWTNENGMIISGDISTDVNMPGVYTLTVTDGGVCSSMSSVTVISESLLSISSSISDVSCFGSNDGSIDVVIIGGTSPFMYDWSDLSGNNDPQDRSGLEAGLYIVTVTDFNECSAEANYTISEPTEIVLFFNTECATASGGGSMTVIASGGSAPYLFDWSNGVQGTETITNLDYGAYTVTVTDINGCSAVGDADLANTINEMLGGDITYCDNSQAQLEVIAPNAVSYEWSTGNLSCNDCPNPIATVGLGEETFYSVTVTEANGCIDIGFVNFNVQSYLDFDLLEFSNSPIYAGQDIVFDCNVPNATTVEWNGPAGFTSTDCNPIISNADNGNAGVYSLEIVDQYGCEASVSPEVLMYEVIESISNDTIICQGDSVQLEVVAPNAVSISWSPALNVDNPSSATPFVSPSSLTEYTVTVENISGGFESISVIVDVVMFPELIPIGPLMICDGNSALLCAEPGNLPGTYLWTWSSGSSSDFCIEPTPDLDGECYELTYTSPNGCVFNDEICIDLIEEIIEEEVYIGTICRTETKELAVTIVSPLTVTYEWSPADFLDCTSCENPIASVLETTIFSVTVTESNGCTDEATVELFIDQGCVWPGDTDSTYTVDNFDLLNIGLAYDSVGPIRQNASLVWGAQPAEPWIQNAPDGTNYKFIDCDGNGLINSDDTLAITQNWGEVHNFRGEDDVQMFGPNYPQSGVIAMVPFYVEPDTLLENETYALPIILGEPGVEAEDVYGIAFTLEYDSAIIVPGSASVVFDGWLGTLNADMIAIQKTFTSPGVIDVAITRTNGIPMDGFGQLSTLYITIEDDVLLRQDDDSRDDEIEVMFNISNVLVINHLGQEIPVVPMETSSTLEETVATTEINWNEYIQVSPNPADEVLHLTAKNINIEKLKLFSISGELLMESNVEHLTTEINTSLFNSGMYLLEVTTDLGVMVEKVMIMR